MRRGVPRRRLTPSPDPQAQLVKPTLAKAAFFSIKFGAFAEALGYLKAANVDPRAVLAGHDSYGLFDAIGDLVRTGPTLTNVNDVRAILVA